MCTALLRPWMLQEKAWRCTSQSSSTQEQAPVQVPAPVLEQVLQLCRALRLAHRHCEGVLHCTSSTCLRVG